MGDKGPDNQIHFVGGILLGATLIGLLAASGKRDLIELLARWQEFAGAAFGAGITLFGARMIVAQIRADDDRETRKSKLETRRAATGLKAEIDAVLDVLAKRQAKYEKLVAISNGIGWDDTKNGMYPMHRLSDEQSAVAKNVMGKKLDVPDLDRLNQRLELVGLIGFTGSFAITFYNNAKELPAGGTYSPFGATASRDKINWAGIYGELAHVALTHVAENGEDANWKTPAAIAERSRIARESWEARVKEAGLMAFFMPDM